MLNLEKAIELKACLLTQYVHLRNAIREMELLGINHSAVQSLRVALSEIESGVEEVNGDIEILMEK